MSVVARPVRVAGAAMFLDALLFGILAPLLPGYVAVLHLSKAEAGVLSGSLAAGMAAASLPAGVLVTRFGPRRMLLVGLLCMAVSSAAFGGGGSLDILVGARLLEGAAGALIWGAGLTWAAEVTQPSGRGATLGSLIGVGIAGTVAGPLLGGVALALSPRWVFGAFAPVCCVLMAAAWTLNDARVVRGVLPGRPAPPPGVMRAACANLWLLLAAASGLGMVAVLGPLLLHGLGVAAGWIAVVFLVAGGAEAAANPVAGRVSDRRGTSRLLGVGTVCLGALLGALPLTGSAALTAAIIVGVSACMGVFGAPISVNLHRLAGHARVGHAHAFAMYSLCWAMGNLVGAVGGSALAQAGGDELPCTIMMVVMLASALGVRTAEVAGA